MDGNFIQFIIQENQLFNPHPIPKTWPLPHDTPILRFHFSLSPSLTVSHSLSLSLTVSHGLSWSLMASMVSHGLEVSFLSLSLTVSHCLSWSLMVTHGVSGFSWSFRVYPHGLSSCFVFMSSCTTCECEREYSQPSQPLTC